MTGLESQIAPLIAALIVLLGTINVYFLKKIKQDTTQVNNAVNHVTPGGRTLTDRVDRIEETLVIVQYDQQQAKSAALEAKESIESTNDMIEKLLESHVHTNERLAALIEKIPKRRTD